MHRHQPSGKSQWCSVQVSLTDIMFRDYLGIHFVKEYFLRSAYLFTSNTEILTAILNENSLAKDGVVF